MPITLTETESSRIISSADIADLDSRVLPAIISALDDVLARRDYDAKYPPLLIGQRVAHREDRDWHHPQGSVIEATPDVYRVRWDTEDSTAAYNRAELVGPDDPDRQPPNVIIIVRGGVADVITPEGITYDLLDWDEYDNCPCNPAQNFHDPECNDHSAETIAEAHRIFLNAEHAAGRDTQK